MYLYDFIIADVVHIVNEECPQILKYRLEWQLAF